MDTTFPSRTNEPHRTQLNVLVEVYIYEQPSVQQVIDVNKIRDRVQGRDVSMCKCVCEYVCASVSVHVHVIVRLCLFVSDDVDDLLEDVDELLE